MTMATRKLFGPGGRAGPVDRVAVRSTARLHLGFLDLAGDLGRRFGSIGLSLDAPAMTVELSRSGSRDAADEEHPRARQFLDAMLRHLDIGGNPGITVSDSVPAHCGMGSGTRLALAVATALRTLHGLESDLRGDAHRLGRGARSGIGIGLFEQGGFVMDGGRGGCDAPPPVLARMEFPLDWRVVVVLDRARKGLSGASEKAAFTNLSAMSANASAEICRAALMQVLPGLAESDFAAFGAGVSKVQDVVGDYFAAAQGGRFTSPLVETALQFMAARGAVGCGQSSWGPTGFAFAGDEAKAQKIVDDLRDSGGASGLDLLVCRALNAGASITCS